MKKSVWVFTTYFTEGLPLMIVRAMTQVYFTDLGVREAYLGLLNFLGIPWNLKFLWAPLLDLFGTKRGWLLTMQGLIAAGVLAMGSLSTAGSDPNALVILGSLTVALAFLAATNDIAIDGYYLEALNPTDQAGFSGLRVMAYRVAIIYARSVLIAFAAYAGWRFGFLAASGTLVVFIILHFFFLPRIESEKKEGLTSEKILAGFKDAFGAFLKKEKVGLILLFLASYKMGDEILFSMKTAFLMRELAVTKAQMAWLAGFVESFAVIGGTMIGGYWIKKKGLEKTIWPMTLLMNVNILAYLVLSEGLPQATTPSGILIITLIHAYENIAGGLGTAALSVYIMRICDIRFKATHFAIGTAITTVGASLLGGFGGVFVEKWGYSNLFITGFVASIPSMVIMLKLPLGIGTKQGQ